MMREHDTFGKLMKDMALEAFEILLVVAAIFFIINTVMEYIPVALSSGIAYDLKQFFAKKG